MTTTILISNTQRDFVAEAQARGSAATTRRGAIRYLIANRPLKHLRAHPFRRLDKFRQRIADGLHLWEKPHECGENGNRAMWKGVEKVRKSHPESKRARDDVGFRRNYLARLRREENRLIADPGPSPDFAYHRLQQIAEARAIATGKPVAPVPRRDWMTRDEIRDRVHTLALCAGPADDWDGSSYCDGRGDHHSLTVYDTAMAPAYNAAPGTCIGIVSQFRRRVYAKRSDWRKSDREDTFLIGENENGNAYAHQIPTRIKTLADAMDWIWSGAEIISRQGDIAVAPSTLKHVDGEEMDTAVGFGHSRHRWIGEVYVNGSMHVRSGFLIHTADQHPPIYLDGSCWRRIVIGRRSERAMSTAD